MFDLNFKENLKEALIDEAVDAVIKNPEEFLHIEEPDVAIITTPGPLYTENYKDLVDLIHETSKQHILIKKQEGISLFGASSVIAIFLTLVTSILVQVDVALADGQFTNREGIQVAITLIGAITSIAARGSEGSQGVYTPHGVPGLNKEDYDINRNGIDDRLE